MNEQRNTERLVVSPKLRLGWSNGRLRVGLPEGRSALFPDASIVTVLHAFARPCTIAEAARASGAPEPMVSQLATDFRAAGFLVVAEEEERSAAVDTGPAPAVTVIMPTFDKAAFLELTLASYARQTSRDFELLLVDDGSTDATAEVAARHGGDLPLRYLRRAHAGRAAARNAALAEARGDILVFSDDDRLVAPDFVAQHIAAHAGASEPLVALGWMHGCVSLLQPGMLGPLHGALAQVLGGAAVEAASRGQVVPLMSADDVRDRFGDTMRKLGTVEPDWERKVAPAVARFGERLDGLEVGWFLGSTGNLSVRRALVEQAGGFDAGYTGYGMEDTDLCYALHRAGGRVVVARRAVSFHQLHPRAEVNAEMARSLSFFCRKHDDLPSLLFATWFFDRMELNDANEIARALAERGPGDAALAALRRSLRAEVLPS